MVSHVSVMASGAIAALFTDHHYDKVDTPLVWTSMDRRCALSLTSATSTLEHVDDGSVLLNLTVSDTLVVTVRRGDAPPPRGVGFELQAPSTARNCTRVLRALQVLETFLTPPPGLQTEFRLDPNSRSEPYSNRAPSAGLK
jgi:hypothetical protein